MNDTKNEAGEAMTPLTLGKPSTDTGPAAAAFGTDAFGTDAFGRASSGSGASGSNASGSNAPGSNASVESAGPRIRWAGIIWGLIVSAIAVAVISITGSPFGRTAFLDWAEGLTAATAWLLVVLVVGGLLLVLGLLALLRRHP